MVVESLTGTPPEEYHALLRTLSSQSLGILQLTQPADLVYQHLRHPNDPERPAPDAGTPGRLLMASLRGVSMSPAARAIAGATPMADAFVSPFAGRRVRPIFARAARWPPEAEQPLAARAAPGDNDPPLVDPRISGPAARLCSRNVRESPPRAPGPGAYDPYASSAIFSEPRPDEVAPSGGFGRAVAQASGLESMLGGAEPGTPAPGEYTPCLPLGPRAPGCRAFGFGFAKAPMGQSGRDGGLSVSQSATDGWVGPGTYHPHPPTKATPSAEVRGRPPEFLSVDGGVGPGAHPVPPRTPDTTPAGGRAAAHAFASRPFLPPRRSAEEQRAVLQRSRTADALAAHSLTPEGWAQQQAATAARARVRRERARAALRHRAAAALDSMECAARMGESAAGLPRARSASRSGVASTMWREGGGAGVAGYGMQLGMAATATSPTGGAGAAASGTRSVPACGCGASAGAGGV